MADPTKHVPPDRHPGQRDCDFGLGTLRRDVARTGSIGAVVQLTDQLHRSIKRMNVPIAVVADVHQTPATRAVTINDIELPRREIRMFGPCVRHPAGLHAMLESINLLTGQEVTYKTAVILALCRVVDLFEWGQPGSVHPELDLQ
jgi:hypothetical protein